VKRVGDQDKRNGRFCLSEKTVVVPSVAKMRIKWNTVEIKIIVPEVVEVTISFAKKEN
jgi:predicted aspartyl protease